MVFVAVAALLWHAAFAAGPDRHTPEAAAVSAGSDAPTPAAQDSPVPPFRARANETSVHVEWGGRAMDVQTARSGAAHGWQRTLTTHPSHVEVRDTVSNASDTVIGVHVRHAIVTGGALPYVAGHAEAGDADRYVPWNPTLFVPLGRDGLGLVVEDDVFRNQLRGDLVSADRTAGLRTDMLCLAPGNSYTMVWSIYPTASNSYWSFVNAVRTDWDVNRTVTGAYVWFRPDDILAMSDDALRAGLEHQRVAVASMYGGWVDRTRPERPPLIGFGTFVLREEFAAYRRRIRAAVAKLKAARPSMKVLLYFDAQRDSSPDATDRYADSALRDSSGRPECTEWGGRYSSTWGMVPTASNGFGRALLEVARAMRALGGDGLYWDEMDGVDYARPRFTTDAWDGRSCVLDDAGRVRMKVALVNLLSDEVKLGYAREGFVLGNMPPTTRRFQGGPSVRMVEAQHNDVWGAFAHLTTPLGYVGDSDDWATVRAKIEEGLLVAGMRLESASDLPARMFPFTPEYLEGGTLRGRERIITTRSGTHGWAGRPGRLRAFRYDAQGKEHAADWPMEEHSGGVFVRVHLGADEAAVIERVE